MKPQPIKIERNRSLLYGTVFLLVAGFIVLILLFVGFTALLPTFMGKCVAVVNMDVPLSTAGEAPSLFSEGSPGSADYAGIYRTLDQRDDVAAVVIVFNSPGGSVVATREVYSAVREMSKPRVSYFREMAASGAYYVASGTDYIISDPDALTGSIGVIATFTDMSGLLDKLGVNVTAVTSGKHKDIGSSFRPMTDEEYNITYALVEEIFSEFKKVVTDNRGSRLNSNLFETVLDGRILSGRQAKAIGLVDDVGTERDAIMKAADLANVSYETYDDIRICQVQTTGSQPGVIAASAESLLRIFESGQGVKISYR